jgi:hypothetical protein
MKKAWVCASTHERLHQAHILKACVEEYCSDYIFLWFDLDKEPNPPNRTFDHGQRLGYMKYKRVLELLSSGFDEIIFTGSDYLVFPAGVNDLGLMDADALFTPHALKLMSPPQQQNVNLVRAGVINSDFQVWRNTRDAKNFLFRLYSQLGDMEPHSLPGLFEQIWMPYALSSMRAQLIRDPGHGISYYNLHERTLIGDVVNPKVMPLAHIFDEPDMESKFSLARTFHFSGFDLAKDPALQKLSIYPECFARDLTDTEKGVVKFYADLNRNAQVKIGK